MTQRTIPVNSFGTAVPRQPRTSSTRRDPWWIPLGEAIGSLFGTAAPSPDEAATNLPREVLRDHDPALYRALDARSTSLDAGRRPMLY